MEFLNVLKTFAKENNKATIFAGIVLAILILAIIAG